MNNHTDKWEFSTEPCRARYVAATHGALAIARPLTPAEMGILTDSGGWGG
ncbi:MULTISPECIES: hypothetical protein [Rhodococcus]|uniref:Uncharacterized protein n=1 Tax=Nocardia globerula TaxID=1818 RepID=A0A652YP88_NOCGL|nr:MULTISPECIES: hypothetical protein [Rhodococcus]NMD63090.1 hypothetical protein [Nocardia globerula]PVX68550.1 hypothetical protein C8E04_5943 [Rhodococcus globerulus]QXW00537.1 hypothetical protein KYT97_19250 [Rhodococcus globerulus]